MKKINILTIIFTIILCITPIIQSVPELPSTVHGTLHINGVPALPGTIIEARAEGILPVGGGGNPHIVEEKGRYSLAISGVKPNTVVRFFILRDGARFYAGQNYTFEGPGGFRNLNLTIVVPVPPPVVVEPNITSFTPPSHVGDFSNATRTFNITIDQIVNVSWLINGTVVQTNTSTTDASYTNTSAVIGTWNVSAIVRNSNGTAIQTWIWNVRAVPSPKIISFAPSLHLADFRNATRTFNITIDQIVNVSWLINGAKVQTNGSVTATSYTNTSAAIGTWNVSAIVNNPNGTAIQTWTWIVISRTPTPCYIATATYGTPLDENINVLRDFRDTVLRTNPVGEAFVSIYYITSPPIADALRGNDELRTVTRLTLITPLVYLSKFAFSDLWVVFIIGLIAILLLRNDRKKILKSLLLGTIVGASSILVFIATIFLLGFAGYTLPFCAVIGAYMLPFVIPLTIVFMLCTVFKTWHKNHTEC